MPRVRGIGRRCCLNTIPNPNPRSNDMLDFIIRFIEELIDIVNFGNDVSK